MSLDSRDDSGTMKNKGAGAMSSAVKIAAGMQEPKAAGEEMQLPMRQKISEADRKSDLNEVTLESGKDKQRKSKNETTSGGAV